ncbi:ubiquitin carboxyl-terminal hydrolase 4 [Limosa lapponica baueri]|uniref:Ubiquitin carboxyl-terminal hydrolase 4 n=1 Tax=Limosa lapponica baueri TaxID=1758121 RepID=A0A2I0T6J1_LIMLA|nr:ubiquitin carboxyl-terminal hydrolase 4 [Limosa lapponica baueri]
MSYSSFNNEHHYYCNPDNDHCHYSSLDNEYRHYFSCSDNEYCCYYNLISTITSCPGDQEAEKEIRERAASQAATTQEEESDAETVIKSFSMKDLQNMRKDFCHCEGETLISWLLQCWDNGADTIDLEGREARQLGNLARYGGTDKATGKKTNTLSLWRQLVSAIKGRYPFKDDMECHLSKQTTMEKGIKYLTELAVQEWIYGDRQVNADPDEMSCK